MLVVIALGGNALLKRGEPMTAENQRRNIREAAGAIAEVIRAGHRVVVTHGNGPQVGLLALQGEAYRAESVFPLDVLGAETEGMIGYLLEQELENALSHSTPVATLLTQIEVDPRDPAFALPSKPIGPIYSEEQASTLAKARGWNVAPDGAHWRRIVPSPEPQRVLELQVIRLLLDQGVIVICAGGGGIPVVRRDDGSQIGVEAVIDKDSASALLALSLGADAVLMLTDVDGVYEHWGAPDARLLARATPDEMRARSFAAGSMAPKVAAACRFADAGGRFAAIGALTDALALLEGSRGTRIAG
ncbi:MAG: carbamate kinase [Pseudomonadota bacterium]